MITTSATKAGQIAKFRAIPIDSQGSPASEYSSAIAGIVRTKRGTNRALRGRAPLARSEQRTAKAAETVALGRVCDGLYEGVTCPRNAPNDVEQRSAASRSVVPFPRKLRGLSEIGGAGPRKPGYGPYWFRSAQRAGFGSLCVTNCVTADPA